MQSLRSSERGLKLLSHFAQDTEQLSLRSSERGLKYLRHWQSIRLKEVAPFVGAWIEIISPRQASVFLMSLRSSERGLKS